MLSPELVERFVMHPDWPTIVDYIEGHFTNSTDINQVDVTKPASTVVGEVIASQKISADLASLRSDFEAMKRGYKKEKITYE